MTREKTTIEQLESREMFAADWLGMSLNTGYAPSVSDISMPTAHVQRVDAIPFDVQPDNCVFGVVGPCT